MTKIFIFSSFIFILFLALFSSFWPSVNALSLDEEISQISQQIADLESAIAPLKQESTDLKSKISSAKYQIQKTQNTIQQLENKLIDKETDLEIQKVLFNERIKNYYKNSKKISPLLILFSDQKNTDLLRQYTWYQAVISRDKNQIIKFGQEINTLSQNKKNLETEKIKLASLQKTLENRFGFLAEEIKKAEDYKAELTQKQQDLIAAKTAMFNTSVGEISTSSDPASRSDYNPGFSPAFAAFSFGAPHQKGMSQFGALGRSQKGQSYQDILKAYYGNVRIETVDMPGSINTTVGTLPFENNYLIGIAEMPATWADKGGVEALKAQAVAARTYALAYTNWRLANRHSTGTICVTEACQVYSSSHFSSPGAWKSAVESTHGQVLVSNSTNDVFSSMYASTSGGSTFSYTSLGHFTPGVWDTTCNSQSCWPNDAYEKISDSPWYYKGWYKTRSNLSCGRSHPWLNQSEFADILNAILYYSKTNDYSHLSQIDAGGCFGGNDPDAWSREELGRQVGSHGGPISSVNSITVDYSTGGYTQNVRVSTDKGDFTFSAVDFKTVFNLRSPGAIVLKSALFNIEKK